MWQIAAYNVHKIPRMVGRKQIAILTEAQQKELGIKLEIPSYTEEKALNDEKVWDTAKLEKVFTIQSRSYDAVEGELSFVVISKQAWTDSMKKNDEENWSKGKAQMTLWGKDEVEIIKLTSGYDTEKSMTRAKLKLTDEEMEKGLIRLRIKIDLDRIPGVDGGFRPKDAATVQFTYPEPKQN